MKVKIGETIFDSEKEPLMVILSAADKENIGNMMPEATCYASFPDDSWLLAINEEVNRLLVDNVGDDASQLAIQRRFVQANPCRNLRLELAFQNFQVVAGDVSDGRVVNAHLVRDVGKCRGEAPALDVLDPSLCHAPSRIHAIDWLNKGAFAFEAEVTLQVGNDPDRATPSGSVCIAGCDWAVSMEPANHAALRTSLWLRDVSSRYFPVSSDLFDSDRYPTIQKQRIASDFHDQSHTKTRAKILCRTPESHTNIRRAAFFNSSRGTP